MYLDQVKTLLIDVLGLGPAGQSLNADSPLLGSLPELDSMAVVTLIGALEEQFGIAIDDDDISASTFATLGSLADFDRLDDVRALADGLRWSVARERLRTQIAEDVRRQREDAGGAPSDADTSRVARSQAVREFVDSVWPAVTPAGLLTRL